MLFCCIFFQGSLPSVACTDNLSCPELKHTEPVQSGAHILELQDLLQKAGFYSGKIDGSYGPRTEEGVRHFQEQQGLDANGVVGHNTWDALALLYEQVIATKKEKEGPKGVVTIKVDLNTHQLHILDDGQVFKTYPIAIGKSKTPSPVGEYKIIHKALNWGTGFGTRWMGLNVPWGIYGIHGTNKPGSIGQAASHGCFRMFNRDVEEIYPWIPMGTRVIVTGYTPDFRGFKRPLKVKSTGQDVAILQYRLQELGFQMDYADGRYGNATELAVKLFEAYHMMQVDGEADMEMLGRLNRYFPE
ncbi:L,D-transpeptidase family protein [Dehalobacterium formicoaceticum]|uniref:Peptidoglycan-binding protein n=1 Tax=Dehalobacterium formicoaceticum TaxID=51515 RepID=A0ABT1Y3X9_9FIRM|nr:peptidoglycan-binding protein [Dehalobacterium formicoaceticum]MCR6545583.1 peptidoglycan-binding protein [Dehalobacterium formicoaceticum]